MRYSIYRLIIGKCFIKYASLDWSYAWFPYCNTSIFILFSTILSSMRCSWFDSLVKISACFLDCINLSIRFVSYELWLAPWLNHLAFSFKCQKAWFYVCFNDFYHLKCNVVLFQKYLVRLELCLVHCIQLMEYVLRLKGALTGSPTALSLTSASFVRITV